MLLLKNAIQMLYKDVRYVKYSSAAAFNKEGKSMEHMVSGKKNSNFVKYTPVTHNFGFYCNFNQQLSQILKISLSN